MATVNFNADNLDRIKNFLPNVTAGAGSDARLKEYLEYAYNFMVPGFAQHGASTPAVDGTADKVILDMEALLAAGMYKQKRYLPVDDTGRAWEHPDYTEAKRVWTEYQLVKFVNTEIPQDDPFRKVTDTISWE